MAGVGWHQGKGRGRAASTVAITTRARARPYTLNSEPETSAKKLTSRRTLKGGVAPLEEQWASRVELGVLPATDWSLGAENSGTRGREVGARRLGLSLGYSPEPLILWP